MPRILAINPTSRPQVYAVRDATQTVTVDLRAAGWNGSCTCDTYQQVCRFLLRHNPKQRQRCDHLLAARQWAMEHEFPELVGAEENIVVLPEYEAAADIGS